MTTIQLQDVYDVHYRNEDTNNEWRRWMRAPCTDLQKAKECVAQLGSASNIADMVHIPKTPNTEWRIVRMVREVIEEGTNH